MDRKLYAQILNEVVQNIIVLNDDLLSELFSAGFDYFIRVDQINPMPCIGWGYDGDEFTPNENGDQS